MVRSALQSNKRIGEGPVPAAEYVPAASVVVAILFCALPIIVENGWFPDFGFLMLIAWRLRRADVWPAWWAALLGLLNDLLTGAPVGLSVAVWTGAMLLTEIAERRILWKDYWIEWALAAVLITLNETAQWQVAGWMGAKVPYAAVIPALFISVVAFPIFAWTVGWIDGWRLRRR